METLEDRLKTVPAHYDAEQIHTLVQITNSIESERQGPLPLNAVLAWCCGQVLISHHRHDFKWCLCKKVAVDGGQDYRKRIGGGFHEIHNSTELVDLVQKLPVKT